MLKLKQKYSKDRDAMLTGKWFDIPNGDGGRIKVRFISNEKTKNLLEEKRFDHFSVVDEERAGKAMKDAIAETIILDWTNISLENDKNGKPIELKCTPDNIRIILDDEDLSEFYRDIEPLFTQVKYWRKEVEENEVKEKVEKKS